MLLAILGCAVLATMAWWRWGVDPGRPGGTGARGAAADDLVRRAHVAVAELENQSLETAVPLLEALAAAAPADPFGPRNLAIAGLLAAAQTHPDAAAARGIAARLGEARRRGDDDDVIARLEALLATATEDFDAAAARWLELTRRRPDDAVAWYGLWRARRPQDAVTPADPRPLARALEARPSNIWLVVEWLRSTAAWLEAGPASAVDGRSAEIAAAAGTDAEIAAAIMARKPAVAPFAPSIIAFARADPRALLDEAAAALRDADRAVAAVRLRAVANLLAPQSEADRRAVDPHPLEFVRDGLAPATLAGAGLGRPAPRPEIPVRFVRGEGPLSDDMSVGPPVAVAARPPSWR